jgi:hypothetical protein
MEVDDIPGSSVAVGVNFDQLRHLSNIWIRRASIFMGIGSNAARVEPTISHLLSDRMQYVFATPNPTAEEARHFVEEFEVWVIANGLRELVEGHALFLDHVFGPFQLITRGPIRRGDLETLSARFERDNASEKRAQLFATLGREDQFASMFESLNIARNCLSHRNGLVAAKDLNTDDGEFELRWRFGGIKVRGEYVDLNTVGDEGLHVSAGEKVQFGPVDKSRRFPLGSQLRITRRELAEICFGFSMAAESVLDPLMAICREKGILP